MIGKIAEKYFLEYFGEFFEEIDKNKLTQGVNII